MPWRGPAWLPKLNSRRYRRVFIACLATLGVSGVLLGTLVFVRWRADRAVRNDTRVVLDQAAEQLLRALESRRGTLTLLRDTLDKAPSLAFPEQHALANSAATHTRHLIGIGVTRQNHPLTWWAIPSPLTSREQSLLTRAVLTRTGLRNVWRVPSSLTVCVTPQRPLLIMLEPHRSAANQRSAVVGVFDLAPLLADFFELTLQQPYPVRLLEGEQALYRSDRWENPVEGKRPTVIEQSLRLDAVNWTLEMQPGSTQTVKTISWLNVLLGTLSFAGGLAAIGIIWLLAMRTWILQRAVRRRTAALRRTTERLRQLAITDELTGLYNRRFFMERWQWECERAKRYERPLGCLMIDVDKFKRINDLLGHPTGDLVLKQVAQELKAQLRQSDFLARLGGDEFIVALPETSYAQAAAVAEKLRELAIHGPWTRQAQMGPVHLSVGLGYIQADDSAQEVMKKADADLYASRQAARKGQTL